MRAGFSDEDRPDEAQIGNESVTSWTCGGDDRAKTGKARANSASVAGSELAR